MKFDFIIGNPPYQDETLGDNKGFAPPIYHKVVVTSQKGNKITVQFSDSEKAFVLDERYTARPSFENDKEIVAVFTEYGRMLDRIRKIRRELDSLC